MITRAVIRCNRARTSGHCAPFPPPKFPVAVIRWCATLLENFPNFKSSPSKYSASRRTRRSPVQAQIPATLPSQQAKKKDPGKKTEAVKTPAGPPIHRSSRFLLFRKPSSARPGDPLIQSEISSKKIKVCFNKVRFSLFFREKNPQRANWAMAGKHERVLSSIASNSLNACKKDEKETRLPLFVATYVASIDNH